MVVEVDVGGWVGDGGGGSKTFFSHKQGRLRLVAQDSFTIDTMLLLGWYRFDPNSLSSFK